MDSPRLQCDLVMRGGITSGIVYPKAIGELSKTFDFRSIGGTSAGALAAVFTAAAQHGENRGTTVNGLHPFEVLEVLPEWLAEKTASKKTKLLAVLQPQRKTAPLFDLLLTIIRRGGKVGDAAGKNGGKSKLDVIVLLVPALWRVTPLAMLVLFGALALATLFVTYSVADRDPGVFVPTMLAAYLLTAVCLRLLFDESVANWLSDHLRPRGAFLVGCILTALTLYVGQAAALDLIVADQAPWSASARLWLVSFPLFLFGLLVATVAAFYRGLVQVQTVLPDNGYGLCTGAGGRRARRLPDAIFAKSRRADGQNRKAQAVLDRVTAKADAPDGIVPLTEWMHRIVQVLAYGDQRDGTTPLTFGDLWRSWKQDDNRGRKETSGGGEDEAPPERGIDLQFMTTDISRGISGRLPFLERDNEELYVREEDLDAYLPDPIAAVFRNQPQACGQLVYRPGKVFTLYRIPAPEALPIALAARMSLSFPILLSAIPMYLRDTAPEEYEKRPQEKEDDAITVHKLWFSDGGLTSNFPIHFFDAPLPNRPTFAINLAPSSVRFEGRPPAKAGAGPRPSHHYVYMPATATAGSTPRVNDFESPANDVAPEARIIKFLEALFDTARNWTDSEQMLVPGYRERIVHVRLDENEGGLNLDMPPKIIEAVGDRGKVAGEFLVNRFGSSPKPDPIPNGNITGLDWNYHRRQRYHVCMAALEHYLERFARAWARSGKAHYHRHFAYGYHDFSNELKTSPLFKHKFQAAYADRVTNEVCGLLSKIRTTIRCAPSQNNLRFDGLPPALRSPRPKATFRLLPAGRDPRERD